MTKRLLINGLKYAVGIALLAYMVWSNWTPPPGSTDIGLKDALARPVQPVPLILAALIFTAGVLLTFFRWFILVRAQELPLTFLNALRLGLLGFFWNTFLPGSIGGDIVKAAYIAREQDRRTVAVSTVLIDRAMGLWGIILVVALLGGTFWICEDPIVLGSGELQSYIVSCVAIVVVTVGMWLTLGIVSARRARRFAGRLGRIPKIGHSAAEFWRAVWMYRSKRSSMATALLISLASQLCFIMTFFYTGQIFGERHQVQIPELREHFLIIPIGVAAQTLPLTPGGMGVGQAVFRHLYVLVDQGMKTTGLLASFARDILAWTLGFIGYFIYLRMRPALRPVKEKVGPDLVPAAS